MSNHKEWTEVNSKNRKGLILFVRKPELGKVKTRLAADVGDQSALDIYNLLLSHTNQVLAEVGAQIYVYYSQEIEQDDFWTDVAHAKRQQSKGDLGDRMLSAFEEVLPSCQNVIIIGSDCAQLRSSHLEEAWSKLEKSDVVIGPSLDGGYYLLGMKKAYKELFLDMPWSTDAVATITKERITTLGLQVAELESLSDIDHAEDWEQYGAPYIFVDKGPKSQN